jgi:hypothetical protein
LKLIRHYGSVYIWGEGGQKRAKKEGHGTRYLAHDGTKGNSDEERGMIAIVQQTMTTIGGGQGPLTAMEENILRWKRRKEIGLVDDLP